MTTQLDDDQLLDVLRDSLAPSAVGPDPAELSAFRAVLVSRFAGMGIADGVAEVVPIEAARRTGQTWSTGLRRVRHPVTALLAAAVLAAGGVAAAGVATDTLPGPARQIAFAVGLPVSSPALETTRGAMGDLQSALDRRDSDAIPTAAHAVRTDLAALDSSDRAQVESAASELLARADAALSGSFGPGAQSTSGTPSGATAPPGGKTDVGVGSGPGRGSSSGQGVTGSSPGVDTNPDSRTGSNANADGANGDPSGGPSGPSGGSTDTSDGSAGSAGGSGASGGTTGTSGPDGSGGGSGSSGGGGTDGSGGSGGTGSSSGSGGSGSPGGSGSAGGSPGTSGNGGGSPDGGSALITTGSGSVPR